MSKKRTLVFDVGDVLVEYRWKDMLMDYGLSDSEAVRVGMEIFNDPDGLWNKFDMGTMTEEEIIAEYSRKHPEDAEAISWFIRHGEFMHVARPSVWRLVHECKKAGYPIYLLSNYPESLFRKHTEHADFMKDIDGLMVSYMIHKAKPDFAIYEALCRKYNLDKSECLFFDDRINNVVGAKEFGMSAIQVTSQEGLLADLEKLL